MVALLSVGSLLGFSTPAEAQENSSSQKNSPAQAEIIVQQDSLPVLSLEEAKERAIEAFPRIRAAALEIESQQALKKTAWDLGNTQIFTGAEEISGGSSNADLGVYTQIGVQQQNIDIFGIAPRLKLQKERVALAEEALDLSILEVELEVSQAWASVYAAKNEYETLYSLDSAFTDIERAAQIRLETETISRLEYLATVNQGNEVEIQKSRPIGIILEPCSDSTCGLPVTHFTRYLMFLPISLMSPLADYCNPLGTIPCSMCMNKG